MKTSNIEPHGLHATAATRGQRSALLAGAKGMVWRDASTESEGQIRDMTVVGADFHDNEDGTGILTIGGGEGESGGTPTPQVNPPITAALSQPPTQAELETAIGFPASEVPGQAYIITDSDTGRPYAVVSDGERFVFVPYVAGSGTVELLSAATGSSNSLQGSATAAEYYNGYTYFAYMTAASDIAVRAWNHATGTVTAEVIVHSDISTDDNSAIPPPDSHDVPTLLVDPVDHKLMLFYSGHDGPALYMSVSDTSLDTDPDLSDGFTERDLDTELGSTSTGYTYTQCAALGSTIVIVFRSVVGTGGIHANAEWAFSTAAAGTRTFAAQTTLGKEPSHGMYLMVSENDGRLDVIASSKSAFDEAGGSLFHFYLRDDGTVYDAGDTDITASLPLETADMTLVWQSDGTQRGWMGHVAVGSDGVYRALLVEMETISPLDARYVYSVLDGGVWSTPAEIAGTGSGAAFFSGAFEPGNAKAVWLLRDVSSTTEVFRYVTNDDLTWASQQITESSAEDNDTIIPVRNANPDLKILWVLGAHAGNEVVDGDIYGAGVVASDGLDIQRIVALFGASLGDGLGELMFRWDADVLYVSDDGGSTWTAAGGGAVALDDLTDVTITAPAENDTLRYVSGVWVNDVRKYEVVTNGEDILVWEDDELVHEFTEA